MNQSATPLSPAAEKMLADAIGREHEELHRRARQRFFSSAWQQNAIQRRAAAVRALGPFATYREKQIVDRFATPKIVKPIRAKYPHFVAAAMHLHANGESLRAIVGFGARLLPGLATSGDANAEEQLLDLMKAHIRRKTKTRDHG